MPLENRNLEPGTVLVARYKKAERTCEVVQTDDATPGSAQSGIRYRLDDGTEHRSPSSAGKQAMGGISCNGWRFWSLQGDLKPAKAAKEPKAEKPAKAPAKKAAKKTAAKKGKGAKKAKAARMASSGSYGCGACGAEFPTMKLATEHALTHTAS